MITTLALTRESEIIENISIEKLVSYDIEWYWVNFECPSEEEATLLSTHFNFHHLAIEDCMDELVERPKIERYDTYIFFVLHALNQKSLEPNELELFVGKNYVVSFSKTSIPEINSVRKNILDKAYENFKDEGHLFITYKIFDHIVDSYYPAVYKIEDYLNEVEENSKDIRVHDLINDIFDIRSELMKLRRIINPMKELLYTLNISQHLEGFRGDRLHFRDVYDHILQLGDIIESSRDVTSDIRDNYLSINSHRMNKIITTLTIITSIFIPLTFVVGIYGMNFDYMPEIRWKYGYFCVLGIMAFIFIAMIVFFKRKGWFDIKE